MPGTAMGNNNFSGKPCIYGLCLRALKECQFNQRKTAKLLDLSYDQLRGYMRKYDLNK